MTITAGQCRAARGLANLSQSELAETARVSRATVATFESEKRTPISNNMDAIRTALEKAGVEFIAENGGGPGVRLQT